MAATTMYVTPAGAGAKDGAAWASAMGEAEFETDLEGGAEAGDIYYVQAGTYTLDSAYNSTARDGASTAPISIIGVKAATSAEPPTISDWGSGADRPTFACGANTVAFGDYYKLMNTIWTFNGNAYPTLGVGTIMYNCKVSQSNASYYAMNLGAAYCRIISSEFSGGTRAISFGDARHTILFCYLHDCETGVLTGGNGPAHIDFNVFDTCSAVGLNIADSPGIIAINNTFYNCPIAVSGTTGINSMCINNVVDTVTDGFKWTTPTNNNFFAYNHVGNSVTDMWDGVEESVAAHKDNWVTGGAGDDPEFTNEASGDFSLSATSPCLDAGMSLTVGVTTASRQNQGAWDAVTAAAGGGSNPRFGDMTGGLK